MRLREQGRQSSENGRMQQCEICYVGEREQDTQEAKKILSGTV